MLDRLVSRGFVDEQRSPDGPRFSARLAPRRARAASVWGALTDGPPSVGPVAGKAVAPDGLPRARRIVLGRRARDAVALVPLVIGFVIGEWFVLTGSGSFADLTAFLGVIVVSLLAGFLPILLFLSSRGKGECALAAKQGLLRHPAFLGAIYLFFLVMLFAHGLIIWEEPIARISALATGVSMVAVPVVLSRSGAFGRRLTIEVCDDQRSGVARFALLSGGRPDPATVSLSYQDGEQHVDGVAGQIPRFDALETRPIRGATGRRRSSGRGEGVGLPRDTPGRNRVAVGDGCCPRREPQPSRRPVAVARRDDCPDRGRRSRSRGRAQGPRRAPGR